MKHTMKPFHELDRDDKTPFGVVLGRSVGTGAQVEISDHGQSRWWLESSFYRELGQHNETSPRLALRCKSEGGQA